jgi:hypothetical protein
VAQDGQQVRLRLLKLGRGFIESRRCNVDCYLCRFGDEDKILILPGKTSTSSQLWLPSKILSNVSSCAVAAVLKQHLQMLSTDPSGL